MTHTDQGLHAIPRTEHATAAPEPAYCTGEHEHPITLNSAFHKHIGLCTVCYPYDPPPRWNWKKTKKELERAES